MKVLVPNYKIVAGSNAIYLTDNTTFTNNAFIKSIIADPLGPTWNFDLKRLLAIINLGTNELIYNPIDSTLGGTSNTYGVTLTKSISSYTGSEKLQIWYDALYPSPVLMFTSNQGSGNAGFAVSSDTALESESYYFVASNSAAEPVKLVIEEGGWNNDISSPWRKLYETVIPSVNHIGTNPAKYTTPTIKFSAPRIRFRVSSAITIYGVPVVTSPVNKIVERRFYGQFASPKNNCLDTLSLGVPSSHVYVPPEATTARISFNMNTTSTYLERTIPITATNNKIDWVTNSTAGVATVTTNAGYTPSGLATAINTALAASGINVTYDTNTKLYTFYGNGVNQFHLLFASGSNNANTIANTVGFPKADAFGQTSYTSSIPMCNFTNVWVEGCNDIFPGISHIANISSGSSNAIITADLGWDIKTGMYVSGYGIPIGTTVATTNGYNLISLSNTITATTASTTLTFYPNVLPGSYGAGMMGWETLYTSKDKIPYPVMPGPYLQSITNGGYTAIGSPTINFYSGYVPPTIAVGMIISNASNIPANTTITSITYNTLGWPTSATMSQNASGTASGLTLGFAGIPSQATLPLKNPTSYPASTTITPSAKTYYMEVPCAGYKWLRLNSCIGVSGTDYVAGSFIINEAIIRVS